MTNSEILKHADVAFHDRDYTETLRTLMQGFIGDNQYVPFYELAAKALRGLKGFEEAEMFERAVNSFDDWQVFYDLGYHYIEMSYWDLAIAFLERANSLNPTDIIVAYEYSLALAARFRIREALEVLQLTNLTSEFWAAYRAFHLSVLLGESIEDAKVFLRNIREQIYVKELQNEDDRFALQKLGNLQEMIRRFEAVGNPELHIRDWHFIQYSSAILDFFETSEEEKKVAGGRGAAVWASDEMVRTVVERLKAFCEMANVEFQKILYIPNRNAEILGRLIGKVLELPTEKLTTDNFSSPNTLIVADSADKFNEWKQLAVKIEGQLIFAFWQSWLEDVSFCPDVIGVLAQMCNLPWEGGKLQLTNIETNRYERSTPNYQNPETIAKHISQIEVGLSVDALFEKNITFYQQHLDLISCKTSSNRLYFTSESPIPGNFFN